MTFSIDETIYSIPDTAERQSTRAPNRPLRVIGELLAIAITLIFISIMVGFIMVSEDPSDKILPPSAQDPMTRSRPNLPEQ